MAVSAMRCADCGRSLRVFESRAQGSPLAICRAALLAVMEEK